jgi:hypothetical protein
VRAAGADSVSIEDGAKILATRVRPPRRPSIKRLAPVGGENTGQRKPVTIRWLATDADKLALEITISYSADNGRKFQIIWTGPNTGSVQLPSRMLPFSNHARVEIEASDGFNTTTAVSTAFHARGAPPAVTIAAPQPRVTQPNDAALLLEGSAFDDAGRQLTGGRLRWFDGDRLLGTGSSLSVSALAAAVHKIRLTATDRVGRKATRPSHPQPGATLADRGCRAGQDHELRKRAQDHGDRVDSVPANGRGYGREAGRRQTLRAQTDSR